MIDWNLNVEYNMKGWYSMSVVVKGMKMPKNGEKIIILTSSGYVEDVSGQVIQGVEAVELSPHGRLIDADVVYDAVERRYRVSSGSEHRAERDFLDLISAAPTIIEAEEG